VLHGLQHLQELITYSDTLKGQRGVRFSLIYSRNRNSEPMSSGYGCADPNASMGKFSRHACHARVLALVPGHMSRRQDLISPLNAVGPSRASPMGYQSVIRSMVAIERFDPKMGLRPLSSCEGPQNVFAFPDG